MNRNRKPMSNKIRKIMEKQVKKGQDIFPIVQELLRISETSVEKEMKKYPNKRWKTEKDIAKKEKEKVLAKKKTKKHAKRTTPGEVGHRESPPASVHPESTRWKRTLDQQNKGKRKALTAKLQKQKGR